MANELRQTLKLDAAGFFSALREALSKGSAEADRTFDDIATAFSRIFSSADRPQVDIDTAPAGGKVNALVQLADGLYRAFGQRPNVDVNTEPAAASLERAADASRRMAAEITREHVVSVDTSSAEDDLDELESTDLEAMMEVDADVSPAEASLDEVQGAIKRVTTEAPPIKPHVEGGEAKAGLHSVGDEAKKTSAEVEKPHVFPVDVSHAKQGLNEVGAHAQHAGESATHAHGPFSHLKELFAEGLATGTAILGLQGLASAVEASFEKFEEHEKVAITLEASFRGMGQAGEEQVEKLKKFAQARQDATTFGSDETLKIVNFGRSIAGITDPKRLQEFAIAVQDMATATGKSSEQIALTLSSKFESGGKDRALGVVFKADENEKNVDLFIQAAKAKFGGLAEDIGKTPAAGVAKFKNAFADVQISVGQVIASVLGPIAPVLVQLATIVTSVLGPIGHELEHLFSPDGPMGKALNGLVGAIGPMLAPIVGIIGPIFEGLGAAIMPIIAAIGSAFSTLGPAVQSVMAPLGSIFKQAGEIIASILTPALDILVPLFQLTSQYINSLTGTFVNLMSTLLPLVEVVLMPLKLVLIVIGSVLNALAPPLMDLIKQFTDFTNKMISAFLPVMHEVQILMQEFGATIGKYVTQIMVSLVRAVLTVIDKLKQWIVQISGAKSASDFFAKALEFLEHFIHNVIAALTEMRAVVAGVSGALTYAADVFGQFLDAITSFNFAKAQSVWANFFDNLGKAYKQAHDKFISEHVAHGDAHPIEPPPEEARPPAPSKTAPGDKKPRGPKEYDPFDDEEKLRADKLKEDLAKATSELERIYIQHEYDVAGARLRAEHERKKLDKDITEARKNETPLTGAEIRGRTAIIERIQPQGEETAHAEATKRITEFLTKDIKANTDIRIAALQESGRAIDAVTEEEAKKRGEFTLDALALQQEQARAAVIEKSEAFKKDLQVLSERIRSEKMGEEQAGQLLTALYESYRIDPAKLGNAELATQLTQIQITQVHEATAARRKIEDEADDLHIAHMAGAYERDRAKAEHEATRKLRTALESIDKEEESDRAAKARREITEEEFLARQQQREDRRIESGIEAAAAIAEAERKYREQTDTWYRVSMLFRDSLDEMALDKKKERNEKELQLEREKLDLEERYLGEKLDHDLVKYREYTLALADIGQRRLALQGHDENVWAQLVTSIRENLGAKYKGIAEESNKAIATTNEEYGAMEADREATTQKIVEEKVGRGMDRDAAMQETKLEYDKAMSDKRTKLFTNAAISIGAQLGQFAAEGHKTFGQYSAMILDTSFKTLRAMIPGWILGIFGSSVEQLGPIAGPLVAAGITGVLYSLLSVAENEMTGGKGFRSGGKVTGGRQRIIVNDDPQQKPEYVAHGEATERYEPTLDAINRMESPWEIARTLFPGLNGEGMGVIGFDQADFVPAMNMLRQRIAPGIVMPAPQPGRLAPIPSTTADAGFATLQRAHVALVSDHIAQAQQIGALNAQLRDMNGYARRSATAAERSERHARSTAENTRSLTRGNRSSGVQ